MKKITLGEKVKDSITGFEGIAVARVVYLNGCVQIQVQPTVDEKGDIKKSSWVDENQLLVLARSEFIPKISGGGGFREHPNE